MISANEQSSLGPIVVAVSVVFSILGAGAWYMSSQQIAHEQLLDSKAQIQTAPANSITAKAKGHKTNAV